MYDTLVTQVEKLIQTKKECNALHSFLFNNDSFEENFYEDYGSIFQNYFDFVFEMVYMNCVNTQHMTKELEKDFFFETIFNLADDDITTVVVVDRVAECEYTMTITNAKELCDLYLKKDC